MLKFLYMHPNTVIFFVCPFHFLFLSYVRRVVETLKDYAIKAIVNTVDHLGSVTYKVNDLLDEKVVEVSGAELRVSCIEQVYSIISIQLRIKKV